MAAFDEDAITAAAVLAERAGARNFQMGWACPHVPGAPDDHNCWRVRWYAHAQFRGVRVVAEDQPDPVSAVNALAARLLDGARCRCGRLVTLTDRAPRERPDSRPLYDVALPERSGACRWRRVGPKWEPGCDDPPIKMKGRR